MQRYLDKWGYPHGMPLGDPPMDPYASPREQVPVSFLTSHARYRAQSASDQMVWDRIATRYPRKFRRAVRYLMWLDRMHTHFSQKV